MGLKSTKQWWLDKNLRLLVTVIGICPYAWHFIDLINFIQMNCNSVNINKAELFWIYLGIKENVIILYMKFLDS